jgi:RNA polymerase sigma-70 factor (ECF subfamily)
VVRQAGRPEKPEADPARARLCQAYWKPIFRHVLHAGYSWHDAEDLTQEFFARVLSRNSLHSAAQEKGKFRSFLLTLLKRFLVDQFERERCRKRGGGAAVISLDSGDTEFRRRLEPIDRLDPGTLCEREWADSVLRQALRQLERECAAHGKLQIYQGLKALMMGEDDASCAETAAALHLGETNVRVTVHRLRRRLRQLVEHAMEQS